MPRFRKKPVVIEAEQFFPDQKPWPEGVCPGCGVCTCDMRGAGPDPFAHQPHVHTLEGNHLATAGDWIITGVKGERYPCKPDVFDLTYEEVQ